jgi:hypothetical protein
MYELQSALSTYARNKYKDGEISKQHLEKILQVKISADVSLGWTAERAELAIIFFFPCRRSRNTWENASKSSATNHLAFQRVNLQPLLVLTWWKWKQ